MTDLSKRNAEILGKDTMLLQTMEECGELIKAISKYNRTRGIGQITETPPHEAFDNLLLELADVKICVEQLIYLLDAETEVKYLMDIAFKKVAKRYQNDQEL